MKNQNLSLQDDKYIRLAKTLLLVGENGEDLVLKYLDILEKGLPENDKSKKDIVIVGAGIAGLLSAYLLKNAGHKVTIVEANPHRIGGRIKTFHSPDLNLKPPFRDPKAVPPFEDPKLYGEAGAMRIPSFHPLVLALVDKLKIQRRLFFNVSVKNPNDIKRVAIPKVTYESDINEKTWTSPYQPVGTYQNPTKTNNTYINTNGTQVRKYDYQSPAKNDNQKRTVREINNGFEMKNLVDTTSEILNEALENIRKHIKNKKGDDLIKGWAYIIEKYDKHSMWSFMKEVAHLSDEEIEAIGTIENITSRLALSFFHSFLGRSDINPNVTYWELEGGTQVLPYAFLDDLKENIVLNRRLVRLEYEHDERPTDHLEGLRKCGARVHLKTVNEADFASGELQDLDDKNEKEFSGDYAIVTVPFSSLRHVQVAPAFSYKKRRAIIELHYDAATKVLLEFSHRWWEMDEQEFNTALKARKEELGQRHLEALEATGLESAIDVRSLSDEVLLPWMQDEAAKHFYKSVKPESLLKQDDLLESHNEEARKAMFGGGSVTDNPNRFTYFPAHQIDDAEGGVVLASYSWSDDARRWDSMIEKERYLFALRNMEALFGTDIKYFYTGFGKTQSWALDPYAFGEAAVFTPGQLSAFHLDIPTNEGPVYFAGEHVSLKHAWIEGALETAIQAAIDVHGQD